MKISKVKIIYLIFLIHLLAIPLVLYWFLNYLENSFNNSAKETYAQFFLSKIEKEIAIHQLASQGKEDIKKLVEKIFQEGPFQSLKLYNSEGKLLLNLKEKKEKKIDLKSLNSDILTEEGILNLEYKVQNQELCYSCHPKENKLIAKIKGSLPLSNSLKIISFSKTKILIITIGLFLIIIFIIALFNWWFFAHPLKALMIGMENVKKGNLNTFIETKRMDEIGNLINNFNHLIFDLKKSKEELEKVHLKKMERAEQLALVGEIASGIAHEIKNPLAGINSALEVLLSDIKDGSLNEKILMQIKEETSRIIEILKQLLDYAKPKPPSPLEFDLGLLIEDIKTIFSPLLSSKEATLKINFFGKNKIIYSDNNVIKQILLNILKNSKEAISLNGEIILNVHLKEEKVLFEIIDNGSGMDENVKNKIFEPFFSTKIGGTGLGLSIVKRKLENLGGNISIESEKMKGTRVIIEIPRKLNE